MNALINHKGTYYFVRLPEDAVFGLVDGNLFQGGCLLEQGHLFEKMTFSILEKRANQIRRADLIRTN